jgi:hypothetical protein
MSFYFTVLAMLVNISSPALYTVALAVENKEAQKEVVEEFKEEPKEEVEKEEEEAEEEIPVEEEEAEEPEEEISEESLQNEETEDPAEESEETLENKKNDDLGDTEEVVENPIGEGSDEAEEEIAEETDSQEEDQAEEEKSEKKGEPSEEADSSWAEEAEEKGYEVFEVKEGEKYEYKETGLSINFIHIDGDVSEENRVIGIKEVELTDEQVEAFKALSNTAYDIISPMENGDFEYELVLPASEDTNEEDVEVLFAEDEEELNDTEKVKNQKVEKNNVSVEEKDSNKKEVKAEKLNHLTIFVVVGTKTQEFSEADDAVVINEFVFDPASGDPEWVELYNKSDSIIDLEGWTLKDEADNNLKTFSAGETIQAKDLLVIEMSNKLNNSDGDVITLRDDFDSVISRVTYDDSDSGFSIGGEEQNIGEVNSGESVARIEDGGTDWAVAENPTKESSNEVADDSIIYVDASNSGDSEEDGSEAHPFNTIQEAIDDAIADDVIEVATGTYDENFIVDVEGLTIQGSNKDLNGNDGDRGNEAIVEGVARVEADNVTIKGLYIDGTNVDQTPSLMKRGILVANTGARDNVTIENNIIKKWVTGVSLAGNTSIFGWVDGAIITGNLFIDSGIGSTENVNGLSITNNAFDNGGVGLGGGAVLANPITGNDFSNGSRYISATAGVTVDFEAMLSANTFDGATLAQQITGEWYDRAIFSTIQDAIDKAGEGSTVKVAVGTYNELINFTKDNLTLQSEDGAETTIITGTAGSGEQAALVRFSANNCTIDGFTLDHENSTEATARIIGAKSSTGTIIKNNILQNSQRAFGGDWYGKPTNITFDGNTFINVLRALSNTEDIVGMTITNNTFTGVGNGIRLARVSGDVVVTGNIFSDIPDGYYYKVSENDSVNDYPELADVFSNNTFLQNASFEDVEGGSFVEGIFATITEAIEDSETGATINVTAGTYEELIIIDKPITLQGATASVNKNGYSVPAAYNWDTTIESVIQNPDSDTIGTVVDIVSDDVVFEGFVVQSLNRITNNQGNLVRLNATTGNAHDGDSVESTLNNIIIRNNIIGPNTNISDQDGTQGRMGLYFASPNYPGDERGITNTLVTGNKIFDSKGNGNNIFVWGAAESYISPGLADYNGTIIEDNEISGSHRTGIEISGGVSGLIIQNNDIHNNRGLTGEEDNLKYGNGILIIRMGSDKSSEDALGSSNLSITGNNIYDNEKNGIYLGPFNKNHNISNNIIQNNGWKGLSIDLEENYHGENASAVYDKTLNISLLENQIVENGIGVNVNGNPLNDFTLNASPNWWGTAEFDEIAPKVVGDVDFNPWCTNVECTETSEEIYGDNSETGTLSTTPSSDVEESGLTIKSPKTDSGEGQLFVAKYKEDEKPEGGLSTGVDGFYYDIQYNGDLHFPLDIEIKYNDSDFDDSKFISLYYYDDVSDEWRDFAKDSIAETSYNPSTISIDKGLNVITANLQHLTPIVPVVDTQAPTLSDIKMYVNGSESRLTNPGDEVTIQATVEDLSGVDKVQIWVREYPWNPNNNGLTSGLLSKVGSSDVWEFTYTVPESYKDGDDLNEELNGNYFNFRPYDSLGNSQIGWRENFTIDKSAPTMSDIKMYVNNEESHLTKPGDIVKVVANITDANEIDKVQVWFRNLENTPQLLKKGEMSEGTGGEYSFEFEVPESYEGDHSLNENYNKNYFIFRTYDELGNFDYEGRTYFTIDKTAPDFNLSGIKYSNGTVQDKYVTNWNTPILVGDLISDDIETVKVSVAGKEYTAVKIDSDTHWEASVTDELVDGEYEMQIKAVDVAGNETTIEKDLIIDTKAPTATHTYYKGGAEITESVAYVSNVDQLSFMAEYSDEDPSSGMFQDSYVIFDANDSGTARNSNAYCSWRNSANTLDIAENPLTTEVPFTNCEVDLPEGEYFMYHQVYDNATRKDIPSINQFRDVKGLHFIVDDTLPTIPSIDFTAGGESVPSNGFTNSEDFTFNLSSDEAVRYQVKYWNDIPGDKYNGENNAWNPKNKTSSYSDHFSRGEGVHHFRFSACDLAGNCSAYSDVFNVTYDNTAPVLASKTEFSGWYNSSQTSVFEYTDDNMPGDYSDPSCEITTEGANQTCDITPNVCDEAGNCNTDTVTSNEVNLDFTNPESVITYPVPEPGEDVVYSSDWDGTLVGTASDNLSNVEKVELEIQRDIDGAITYWNGIDWQASTILVTATGTTSWTYGPLDLPLVEGEYNIESHATDKAGNMENTFKLKIVFDKTIPTVDLSINPGSPNGDNDWYDSEPEITLSANDNSNLDKIEYQIDSQTGAWNVYSSPVEIEDGEKIFYYRSCDKAGNVSDIGEKNVKVDTEDPEDPNDFDAEYRAGSQTVRLSWDADSDVDKFYLYRGGSRDFDVAGRTRIAKQDGNDDAYNDDDIELGEKYYYKIVARDEAGNSSDAEVISIEIPENEEGEAVVVYEGVEPIEEGDVTEEEDVNVEGEKTEEENLLGDTEGASDDGDSSIVKGDQDQNQNQNNWKVWVAVILLGVAAWYFYQRRNKKK